MALRFYLTKPPENRVYYNWYLTPFNKVVAAHYPIDCLMPRWLRNWSNYRRGNPLKTVDGKAIYKHPKWQRRLARFIYIDIFNNPKLNKPLHEILRRIRRKLWQ